jgi:hypothetical protein
MTEHKPSTWHIYRLHATHVEMLGIIEAPDQSAAVVRAMVEYDIDPAQYDQIVARRDMSYNHFLHAILFS